MLLKFLFGRLSIITTNQLLLLNLLQNARAEHRSVRTEDEQTFLSKKEKLLNLSLSKSGFSQGLTLNKLS